MLPQYAASENANDHPQAIHLPVDPLNCPGTVSVPMYMRGKHPHQGGGFVQGEPHSQIRRVSPTPVDVQPMGGEMVQNHIVDQRKNHTNQLISRLANLENQQAVLFKEAESLLKAHNVATSEVNMKLVHMDEEIMRMVEAINVFVKTQYAGKLS